jgi:RimJ/RimL family protein N-acetyltransferase
LDVHLIPASKINWDFILSLRNDFYNNFYQQTRPLTKDEHYEYLERQKCNPKFHHWVITFNDEIVGYVRLLDFDVGIMLKKNFQNKGIASYALELVEKEAKLLGTSKLLAKIHVDNISSHKIFEKNNYIMKFYLLEKDLK